MQIDYVCFCNRSGYAQAAQDYIYALKKHTDYDVKISLLHSSPEELSLTSERYRDYQQMMRKDRQNDAIQIFHCIPDMQKRVPKAGKTIGFATFETFDPPAPWVNLLNQNDAVICPSEFNRKVFEHAGLTKPIHHIPHCVDTDLYNDSVQPFDKDTERFTFLFFGTWKKRKGYTQLLEAWMREFDANDKVRLLIKTDRYTLANRAIADIKNNLGLQKKEIAPISFESRVLDETQIPRVFKTADCLICPTLGEGFGIPGLQCMALGVPVIITNFSGCTDYANEKTATLIEPNGFIVYNDLDQIPQFVSKKWAHVTVESVQSVMREAFTNQEVILKKADYAKEVVTEQYSYPAVAKKIQQMVESL